MGEKLDIFNTNYEHIGTEDREVVHQKGLWHQTFHCWIVNPETKSIVLQLRSAEKPSHPNELDISAAGHIKAGEDVLSGVREIEEEMGLKISEDKVIYLGTLTSAKDNINKDGSTEFNREFYNTYFLKDSTPISEYIMQPEEVDGVFEIGIEDGLKFFSDEIKEIEIKGFSRLENKEITRKVTFDDFVKHSKKYYLKIFIMAERLIEGKKYLAV